MLTSYKSVNKNTQLISDNKSLYWNVVCNLTSAILTELKSYWRLYFKHSYLFSPSAAQNYIYKCLVYSTADNTLNKVFKNSESHSVTQPHSVPLARKGLKKWNKCHVITRTNDITFPRTIHQHIIISMLHIWLFVIFLIRGTAH